MKYLTHRRVAERKYPAVQTLRISKGNAISVCASERQCLFSHVGIPKKVGIVCDWFVVNLCSKVY